MSNFLPPSLCDMPDAVMNNILKDLEFYSIQTLRKVCRDLRHFIDDTHQMGIINSVKILVGPDRITIDYNTIDKIVYQKHGNGCSVGLEQRNQEKQLKNENYTMTALKDLCLNLGLCYPKPSVIEFFGFYSKCSIDKHSSVFEFLSIISCLLKSQKLKIEATKFQIEAITEDEIMFILPYLEPVTLKEIRIFENKIFHNFHWIDLRKVVKLEQWKMAKKVIVEQVFEKSHFSDIGHFERVRINLETVNSDDLLELKQVFIESTTCQVLLFSYSTIQDFQNFLEGEVTFFWIPESENVLEVRHNPRNRQIRFTRTSKEKVFLNAEVLS